MGLGNTPCVLGNTPVTYRAMSTHDKFLSEIEAFLTEESMRPTTFGIRAMNDAKFVTKLRDGADVTTRTMDRVRQFICEYPKRSPKPQASARPAA